MPLPLILAAGAAGLIAGGKGAYKFHQSKTKLKDTEERHKKNLARLESSQKEAISKMDELGRVELEVLASFEEYSKLLAQIHNRPQFGEIQRAEVQKFTLSDIEEVSVGASVLLGGLGGAALGTLGGWAASGITTSVVMTFGTASTGTAISTLSGAAATNATLAALGGGSIAAGGGGVALGTAILTGATLGVGLLVGGIIFNITGSKLSDKADKAYDEMLKMEAKIDKLVAYLAELSKEAMLYKEEILKVRGIYDLKLSSMKRLVEARGGASVDWNLLPYEGKRAVEQTTLLVGLLYEMCKVQFVKQTGQEIDEININDIRDVQTKASSVLASLS